jgi:TRAP-type C4-dicarboxylate transport system permease large subunit
MTIGQDVLLWIGITEVFLAGVCAGFALCLTNFIAMHIINRRKDQIR